MTNAHRIQSLPQEELALFLTNMVECGGRCPATSCCTNLDISCKVIFLKWLNNNYSPDEELEAWDY